MRNKGGKQDYNKPVFSHKGSKLNFFDSFLKVKLTQTIVFN